jgi:hypothetical protein
MDGKETQTKFAVIEDRIYRLRQAMECGNLPLVTLWMAELICLYGEVLLGIRGSTMKISLRK